MALEHAQTEIHPAQQQQPEHKQTLPQYLLDRYGLLASAALTGVALVLGWGLGTLGVIGHSLEVAFYVLAYISGGTLATIEAVRALWARRIEIDLLMVMAAFGAAVIGHWAEGAILLFLFSLGNALEDYALGRTKRAVRSLMELSPEEATVLRDGVEQVIPAGELVRGDVIVVRPGERIAADGDVLSGSSAVDQSAITGESVPAGKHPGDQVFAGTINGRGAMHVTVTRLSGESTLAKIIRIVQEAREEKSDTQRFTDRFEGTYAGAVIGASALYLLVLFSIVGMEFGDAFYRSMILLVVASPCALVISTPASMLSALANAARHGILVKGAAHLENIGAAKVVAFDKTGTLTVGEPRVTDLHAVGGHSNDELLGLAASAERMSEHPLAEAIVRSARERDLTLTDSSDLQAITGQGIDVRVGDRRVLIGNDRLLQEHDIEMPAGYARVAERFRADGKTTMHVASQNGSGSDIELVGIIAVADTLRPGAREAIEYLHSLGVEGTVILTGDNRRSAEAIAAQVGITDVQSELLPEDKLDVIERMKRDDGMVVMVGDGVNDAPALARASIGVAMGAAGSDVALETADIVLMADDLGKLPYALQLSRRARRIIRQNLTFALTVIAVLVTGTLLGVTTLPLGVVGHEGSTIIVVANGLRLLSAIPARTESQEVAGQRVSELSPAGD
ncbi:MAG: heavy metal translocating P-type ATPase [Chloroflexota bacterium]